MSVILCGGEQISRHQLNSSVSKQQFSFPRSRRFSDVQKVSCVAGSYDIPDTKTRRGTSFGYGTKTDFTRNHMRSTPSPTAYQIPTISDNIKSKGFSFGIRPKSGGIVALNTVLKNPGPGTYTIKSPLDSRRFSMAARTKYFVNINEERKNKLLPGPGAYDPKTTMSDTGTYFISKYHNSKASTISPSTSARFNPKAYKTASPGPGAYEIKSLNNSGSSFNSKYESVKCGKFSSSISRAEFHEKLFKSDVPGPGSYIAPSDFGVYISSKATGETMSKSFNGSNSFIVRGSTPSNRTRRRPNTGENFRQMMDSPIKPSKVAIEKLPNSPSVPHNISMMSSEGEFYSSNTMISPALQKRRHSMQQKGGEE